MGVITGEGETGRDGERQSERERVCVREWEEEGVGKGERERVCERQRERKTDGQMSGPMEGQTDQWTNKWTVRPINKQTSLFGQTVTG